MPGCPTSLECHYRGRCTLFIRPAIDARFALGGLGWPRYAVYLLISAAAVCVVALATDVTDIGLLLGETLPFYAAIFMLLWNGALTAPAKDLSRMQSGGARRLGSPKSAD